jgi:hypothetical protein
MADIRSLADAARRAACAVVQTTCGAEIELRIPAPPVAGDDGEELGLRTPGIQVKPVGPAAVIRTARGCTVLMPAPVLERAFAVSGAGAVREAFLTVMSVVIEDEAFVPMDCEPDEVSGAAYLYRLTLEPDPRMVV